MATQTLAQSTQSNLLRFSLRLDSLTAALSGVLLIVAAQPIVEFLGVGAPWMMIAGGVVFLLYAADLWWIALREPINLTLVLAVVGINGLWVLASAVILFTNWLPLTTGGWWAIAIVAYMVAIIAGLQFYAWWKESRR